MYWLAASRIIKSSGKAEKRKGRKGVGEKRGRGARVYVRTQERGEREDSRHVRTFFSTHNVTLLRLGSHIHLYTSKRFSLAMDQMDADDLSDDGLVELEATPPTGEEFPREGEGEEDEVEEEQNAWGEPTGEGAMPFKKSWRVDHSTGNYRFRGERVS